MGRAVDDGVGAKAAELAFLLCGLAPAPREEEVGLADLVRVLVIVWVAKCERWARTWCDVDVQHARTCSV